ncbi:MAG: alpha-galactosidase [Bacteroidetes bacterium]|nr:alpha-galactosidase [Bacteroidota bacterium]
MKTIILSLLTCIFIQLSWANSVKSCYAHLQNDTLRVGNDYIERVFVWNSGNIITCALIDKESGQIWKSNNKIPDLTFPLQSKEAKNSSFKSHIVPSNGVHSEYFEAEVSFTLDSLSIKRIYRVYPSCSVIACDTYLKGQAKGEWVYKPQNIADLQNIEKLEEHLNQKQYPVLDHLSFTGKHWSLESIEFMDITDRNNTLVKPVKAISYRANTFRGNILFAHNSETNKGFFILKEAPCSSVQLAYPENDFVTEYADFKVIGLGVDEKDLSTIEWTKTYSCVLGVYAGDEVNKLTTLHNYQKQMRPEKSLADEMIMMNTWGDRGQDTKVNESFCMNELKSAARLGITHFQIDDGWQSGRSANSAFTGGTFKNIWSNPNYWTPDPKRYPNGIKPVVDAGQKLGINVCLWFNPSIQNDYIDWKKDAKAILTLYKEAGIKVFKIDGLQIPNRLSEKRLRMMFDEVLEGSNREISFNLDVTAGRRGGYFYFNDLGNIFLENRYTDWQNYYPYWTLRNLWMLSKYIPTQKLQIEFLNKWRNQDKYAGDIFGPKNYSFEYLFAITMAAQPLAWMEGTGLPEEAFSLKNTILKYKTIQHDFHQGVVLPIGDEPSGSSWTGFQSIKDKEGYLLIFREYNMASKKNIVVHLPAGTKIECVNLFHPNKPTKMIISEDKTIPVEIKDKNDFIMYKYKIL